MSNLYSFIDANTDHIHQIAGALLVVLFYYLRFNSLSGARSYTAANLYFIGLLAFILPYLGLYLFVLIFSSPVIAVVVVISTWLLPRIGPLWRKLCYKVAR